MKICIIYIILKYISNVNYLIKLLYQFVTAGVRYGDFIKPLSNIEWVHLQFCKRILHVKKSTAIFFVYSESGRFPLAINRHLKISTYWLKIKTHKTNTLVYNLYRYQYEQCELEHANNWASKVKEMLNNLGFNCAWINQNVHNTFIFFKLCNQRLKDQYFSNWNTSMSSSPDGKLYQLIKENIICSKCMNVIKVQKHKFAYIKFVTKNCNIPVVSGKWYHRKVYNERIGLHAQLVMFSGMSTIFFLECQINTDIRSTYLSPYSWRKPSMSKFIELMTCDRCGIISKLAVFIFESLKLLTEP